MVAVIVTFVPQSRVPLAAAHLECCIPALYVYVLVFLVLLLMFIFNHSFYFLPLAKKNINNWQGINNEHGPSLTLHEEINVRAF